MEGDSPISPERTGHGDVGCSFNKVAPAITGATAKEQQSWPHVLHPPREPELATRHAAWERELEATERCGLELMAAQWKLMRVRAHEGEVMLDNLTQGLTGVQAELEALQATLAQGLAKVHLDIKEADTKLNTTILEERALRLEFQASAGAEFQRLGESMAAESFARALLETRLGEEATRRATETQAASRELAGLERASEGLRAAMEALAAQLGVLRGESQRETEAREAAEQEATRRLQALQEEALQGWEASDVKIQALRKDLDQERADRDSAVGLLHARVLEVDSERAATRQEELCTLRGQLREVADELHAQHGSYQRAFEQAAGDRASGHACLQQHLVELTEKVQSESAARVALREELDRVVLTSQASIRATLTEGAEAARRALDLAEESWSGRLQQEVAARTIAARATEACHAAQYAAADRQMGDLRQELRELTGQWALDKAVELQELTRQLRDQREQQRRELEEQRRALEAAMLLLEDRQNALLGSVLQDLGRRFLQNASRRPCSRSTPGGASTALGTSGCAMEPAAQSLEPVAGAAADLVVSRQQDAAVEISTRP